MIGRRRKGGETEGEGREEKMKERIREGYDR